MLSLLQMRVETDTLPPLVELGRKLLTKAQEGDADGVKDLMQQGAPFTTDWVSSVLVVVYNEIVLDEQPILNYSCQNKDWVSAKY